jgi:PilZ domain
MTQESSRIESRIPIRVTVDLASLELRTPAQQGTTENVSAHGARILTRKPWQTNARLNLRSLLGSLRSRARVVYCEPTNSGEYAVGVELSATAGEWTSAHNFRSVVR